MSISNLKSAMVLLVKSRTICDSVVWGLWLYIDILFGLEILCPTPLTHVVIFIPPYMFSDGSMSSHVPDLSYLSATFCDWLDCPHTTVLTFVPIANVFLLLNSFEMLTKGDLHFQLQPKKNLTQNV